MNGSSWSPDEDSLALRCLNEGKSFREIAKLLKRSRSAVIAHSNREGWTYPGKNPASHSTKFGIKTKPIKREKKRQEVVLKGAILLENASNNQCRFIGGEGRSRLCCGRRTLPGHSWCAIHAPVVYGAMTVETRRLIAQDPAA